MSRESHVGEAHLIPLLTVMPKPPAPSARPSPTLPSQPDTSDTEVSASSVWQRKFRIEAGPGLGATLGPEHYARPPIRSETRRASAAPWA